MKPDATRITLRQLCSLGLPATLLLPSLLPVLRDLVPATHAGFFFCDEAGQMVNLYAEHMLSPQDMARFHERHSQQQFREQYLQRVAAARPVSRASLPAVAPASAAEQAYRNEVLRPLRIGHVLYAIVRHRGRALGQLSLYRDEGAPAFTAGDEEALFDVLHYLGQALAVPTPSRLSEVLEHTVEEGLALLDGEGREMYADDNWPRLVRLAQGNTISPAQAEADGHAIPHFVRTVLAAVLATPQALHRVDTAWGQFAFRRYTMAAAQGAGSATALIVSRMAAEPLRLAQGAAAAGLSPQQREVAVLMAQGLSNAEIASQLSVTLNTVSYHVKKVFERLQVHERIAIGRALSAAAVRGG